MLSRSTIGLDVDSRMYDSNCVLCKREEKSCKYIELFFIVEIILKQDRGFIRYATRHAGSSDTLILYIYCIFIAAHIYIYIRTYIHIYMCVCVHMQDVKNLN